MDYPSNSREGKVPPEENPPKKLEPVVTEGVKRRKRPMGKRFSETFLGGDAQSVGSYVVFDILIPGAKDMILDMVYEGMQRAFFGEVRSPRRGGGSRIGSFSTTQTPYNRVVSSSVLGRREDPRMAISQRARAQHEFDEIILPSRAEADEVLHRLYGQLEQYQQATVSDLYDFVNVKSSYMDEKFGWTDLSTAGVSRLRGGGYLLDLPKPVLLD
jgi:hypothetical protein